MYSAGSFNFGVNQTFILNEDYKGNKLTDDYLVVVSVNLQSYSSKPFLNDFNLNGREKMRLSEIINVEYILYYLIIIIYIIRAKKFFWKH